MKKHALGLAATAVVAGLVMSVGVAGAANAADEIIGQGSVTLDFSSTPGSVEVDVWTKNLSTVEAWGSAVVQDAGGTLYPFGPRLYAPGEEWTFSQTLAGYTCADLGGASAVAFGFGAQDAVEAAWSSGLVRYPDPRVTVIGCPTPNPTAEEPEEPEEPEEEPGVTPTDGGTTTPAVPTASGVNTLPAAKTDGALLAHDSSTSPLFGMLSTLGALVATGAGAVIAGARRRR
ncbi:hypothetical protein ABZ477_09685 [Microbacterium sp. NPDC019599]|uniref:hypothetical protein n=1 Tax=Microbacterium sp. NPDC019599 TaxID=3154690 RepID=UPI0033DD34A9